MAQQIQQKDTSTYIAMPSASAAQIQALTDLRAMAVRMLDAMEGGAGCKKPHTLVKTTTVSTFQTQWNTRVSTLKSLYKSVGVAIGPLTIDGKYGPKTAFAVWLCLVDNTGFSQSAFYTHACDVANPDGASGVMMIIERLSIPLVQQAPAPAPRPQPKPLPTPSKPVAPAPVSRPAPAVNTDAQQAVTQGQGGGTNILPSQDVSFSTTEVAPVEGTTSKGLSTWVYVAIGASVFGVGFAWWRWGKKK
jgi:hypothetical protein